MNVSETLTTNLHLLPKPSPTQNLPAHVHSVLFEAILSGVLAPGERLLVDDVAEHFGVSKIPVREALKALEVNGWVEIRPRRGTFVKPLSEGELRQIFEMRRVLEPYSAKMAAVRRKESHLEELGVLLTEGIQAIRQGDVVSTTRINSRFHSVMAEAVGNQILGDAVTELELRLRRYFIAVDWTQRSASMEQHRAIYEAVRDQDAKRAEKLTLAHLDHTETLAVKSVLTEWGQ